VSQTNHLVRRKGTWYYRRRVPLALVGTIGSKFIQFSLHTTDLVEAKKRRAVEDIKAAHRFEAAGGKSSSSKFGKTATGTKPQALSQAELHRLVCEYVEQSDDRWKSRLIEHPPQSRDEQRELMDEADYDLCLIRNRDDPGADQAIYASGKKILQNAQRSIDELLAIAFHAVGFTLPSQKQPSAPEEIRGCTFIERWVVSALRIEFSGMISVTHAPRWQHRHNVTVPLELQRRKCSPRIVVRHVGVSGRSKEVRGEDFPKPMMNKPLGDGRHCTAKGMATEIDVRESSAEFFYLFSDFYRNPNRFFGKSAVQPPCARPYQIAKNCWEHASNRRQRRVEINAPIEKKGGATKSHK